MTAPDAQTPDEFGQIVRKIVIHERRGILKELAESLGLSYGAFYNRLSHRAEFNPREINMLLRELADRRMVDCLLAGTEFHALRRPAEAISKPDGDVTELALSSGMLTLSAVRAVCDVLRNRDLDRERAIQIENLILQAQKELSSLQVALLSACH